MTKTLIMAGVALAALAATPAWAQQPVAGTPPEAASDTQPADIIVTAQKRSERLQDVPVAVSVVSGAALESQGKVSLEGAVNLVPSFNFLKSGTTLNQSLFLRGVGTATFSIAGEPSVSTVVDGVVYSRSGEAFSELVDVDRLEVLRGPQGTLFGKNASAGVINIISRQPSREFGGYLEGSFFTKSEYRARAALNVPFTENIRGRVNGFYTKYDGNITNVGVAGNPRVNGFEHYGGRAQLDVDFSPDVTLKLAADYHHNNDNCCAEVIGTGTAVVDNTQTPPRATGFTFTNPIFSVLPTPLGDRTRTIAQNLITTTIETGYGFSGTLNATLRGVTVTSITAYRNYKNTEIRDGDFLPAAYIGFNQLHDFGPQVGNTFSQELRLTSPGHQFFDYVLGAYFSDTYSERVFTRNDIVCTAIAGAVLPAATPTPCTSPLANPSTFPTATADFGSTFKNLAFFGQGTVNFNERLRLFGGLRFTADQLNVFHSRNTTLAGPGINPSFPVTPNGTGQPATPFTGKTTSTNLSGKGGVQFDLTRNNMIYATYARGYKGPAFNVFFNLAATGTNVIAPETSDAYEVGLKNTFFNGHLVLNLAGYYAKYHNFQANNPDLVAGVVVTRFTNAGDVSTRGGEVDLIWRPVRDLNISGGAAYTDAHVDNFLAAPGAAPTAIIASGTRLGFAPKFKGSLAADYRYRTGGAVDFTLGAQGNYQSSQLSLFSPDPVLRQLGTIGAYGLVNLSAGILDANDRYRITFQVRNVFNQSFAAAIANGGPGGSYRYQIPRDADRYFGVTARVNFGK